MSDSDTRVDGKQLCERLLTRLGGFVQGIGLSVPAAWEIVERAIADGPHADPADIEAKARAWMLIALA
ncbi:hypothetical protein MKK75_31095 [Methylobacterium sp. J-030]|uniref:hypothetical protein n=1 Tax=Methylobacterium sp. J-030 TaxID=2836627 RepID=UPI001FBA38C5|nr:hypothetical protein [Methylobacterium sp. J-030]MCJ2073181.1 hypothetical protein [Methylobacterium sp. J-030]